MFDRGKSSGGVALGDRPYLISKFSCLADGYPRDNFQGEIIGMIAAFMLIDRLTARYSLPTSNINIWIDSDPALRHLSKRRQITPNNVDKSHSETLWILYYYHTKSNHLFNASWVKAHQDKSRIPTCHLFATFLNIQADIATSSFTTNPTNF